MNISEELLHIIMPLIIIYPYNFCEKYYRLLVSVLHIQSPMYLNLLILLVKLRIAFVELPYPDCHQIGYIHNL